jgi:hypothetical protein
MELLLSILLILNVPQALTKDKTSCLSRELQRKDCRVKTGTYNVRLLSETIARDDGTWHTVDAMPLIGDHIAWEKIRFDIFKGWPILQLWIWDKAVGEAGVQDLRWFVADLHKGDMKILAKGVVRRRRLKNLEVQEGKPAPPPSYNLDAFEKHGLKLLKDGDLEWTLGSEKKILKKADEHGI